MKMFDINKKLTEYVGKYISEGYVLSNTMAGHQGEINKIDLVKDKELIRVWINHDRVSWSDDPDVWHGEKVVLRVSRWRDTFYPSLFPDNWTTVWNSDLEDIENITYYQVGNQDWYFDNIDDAMHYQRVHYARLRLSYENNKSYGDVTSPKTQEIAARFLKRRGYYQRVSRDNIVVKKIRDDYENKVCYKILYNDKVYHI